MKNGRLLLEELIAFCNGKSNSICVFSIEEFKRATNNYDHRQCILQGRDFKLFKGSLEDRLLSAKKYDTEEKGFYVMEEVTLGIIKDIVVGFQMSVHQNVVKLFKTLLETKYPTPMYEFVRDKILSNYINLTGTIHFKSLTWKRRA
ncbi:hypothetical protein SO802_009219 [Lithocarpus litseifolius]|uniref:Uncharacterized protein n=1 Tax=Lithocarpus litseifolius TaxID=425828 RepID=A0AAW2DAS7_9ROSI